MLPEHPSKFSYKPILTHFNMKIVPTKFNIYLNFLLQLDLFLSISLHILCQFVPVFLLVFYLFI